MKEKAKGSCSDINNIVITRVMDKNSIYQNSHIIQIVTSINGDHTSSSELYKIEFSSNSEITFSFNK